MLPPAGALVQLGHTVNDGRCSATGIIAYKGAAMPPVLIIGANRGVGPDPPLATISLVSDNKGRVP
jgi:hypothetical protein